MDWSGSSECCPSFCPTLKMRIGHSLSVCLWSYHTSSSSPSFRMQVRRYELHSGGVCVLFILWGVTYAWRLQLYLQKIRQGEGVFSNLMNTREQCYSLLHATWLLLIYRWPYLVMTRNAWPGGTTRSAPAFYVAVVSSPAKLILCKSPRPQLFFFFDMANNNSLS